MRVANVRTIQTNFSGGALDPLMKGRPDTKMYNNGAETIENWMQLVQGGLRRRRGTKKLSNIGAAKRLLPFVFNKDQTYIIALGNTTLDVYDPADGSTVQTQLTGCPWTTAQLNEIRYAQRGDTMILTHEDFRMQVITRTGASSFTRANWSWSTHTSGWPMYSPQYKYAGNSVTIQASATTGSITLTTSAAHWTSDHDGCLAAVSGRQCEITEFVSSTVVNATVRQDLYEGQDVTVQDASQFEVGEICTQADTNAEGEIVSITGNVIRVANRKRALFENNTTTVGGTSGAESDATGVSTISPQATADWTECAMSPAQGWARSVTFHGQRLWFGGAKNLPSHLFSSKVAAFYNFDTGEALDDESVQASIAADKVNTINHLISAGTLQVYTDQGEFYCPESQDNPLSPTSFNIRKQSPYGSGNVSPMIFDRATIFVQQIGTAVREFLWEEINGGYTANAISLASNHLIDPDGIVDASVLYGMKERPEQYVFFVNNDGSLAVYHAVRVEQISSWVKWVTDGNVKNVVTVLDEVFFCVERTVGGSTVYSLEKLDDTFTLDMGESSSESASETSTFTGLTNWTSQEVHVVAAHGKIADSDYRKNAYDLGKFTVDASGNLDISPYKANSVQVGFSYDATLKTLPIEIEMPNGSTFNLPKRISAVDVNLDSTLGIEVDGTNLILRNVNDDMSAAPTPKTGHERFYMMGWSREGQITIEADTPLDATILSLSMEVTL